MKQKRQQSTDILPLKSRHLSFLLVPQSNSEVMVALMTLETALKAASMQRMPTPNTTEGAPSAAIAAVGVMRTAGTAAPAAISSGVPRSCACGPGAPRNATLRTATNATSATHSVINLDERAMAKPFAILIVRMRPTLEPQIQHSNDTMCNLCTLEIERQSTAATATNPVF